ncbi:MAG: 3'(2'),5'-bisphosphate nucleotidase CysQ [Pseudomonadota bacterium]
MPDAELTHNDRDLILLKTLGYEAGQLAMRWFGPEAADNPEVWMKEGDSPVSQADFAVDEFLRRELLAARPDYGWLSEETDDDGSRQQAKRTFVIDPIDGTRGFLNHSRQWCVSLAIVEDNRPVTAVLECPALGETLTATADGPALLNGKPITACTFFDGETLRVTGPRSAQTALMKLKPHRVERMEFVPSLAYRIAMVAMARADLIVARGSAKDWDLAAADLICHRAGGRLTDRDGSTLAYNCRDVRHGQLVASCATRHDEMLDLARRAIDKAS